MQAHNASMLWQGRLCRSGPASRPCWIDPFLLEDAAPSCPALLLVTPLQILFFICIFSAFNALFGALNTFPTDRAVVRTRLGCQIGSALDLYNLLRPLGPGWGVEFPGSCPQWRACSLAGLPKQAPRGYLHGPRTCSPDAAASFQVNRERAGKAYRVSGYYAARFICDMPLRITQTLLFGGPCRLAGWAKAWRLNALLCDSAKGACSAVCCMCCMCCSSICCPCIGERVCANCGRWSPDSLPS